ncbi:MAG: GntR family transcriptional regulator [Oscillospiraceae bacterium]|nr:GntR family transcriptional regulator [Oscillospiraceae bacterium]
MELHPITLLPARERVASALREAILSHQLKAGRELTLKETSQMLGVSVTPIREAFQQLAQEGLIELRPNRGAMILGVDARMIREHYELRAVLERETAMATCRNGADLSRIRNAFEYAQKALEKQDSQEYGNFNQSFHMEIWKAGGNRKIEQLLSQLWNGLSMGHKVTRTAYAQISMSEHAQIMDALERRDERQAGELMDHHIRRSMENILTHLG